MTHLAMPEQWSFAGTDFSTYAYMVRSVDGADTSPALRGEDLVVPGIVGRRPQGKKAGDRRIALALWVQPLTAAGGRDPGFPIAWQATHAYLLGDLVMGSGGGATHYYEVTVAGTSAGAAPTWPTTGGTVTDGGVTWTDRGVYGAGTPLTNAEQARANLDALYRLLGYRGQEALVRTMPDGSNRTAQAECVAVSDFEDIGWHEAFGLVADFQLADPWFYGAQDAVTQATPSASTDFILTNPGTIANHRLLLDFTGPIANPRIANLTIDSTAAYYVECLASVATDRHLLIDCEAWTALNDGAQAIGSIRHSGGFEFFSLAPGANSLRVTAATPGGSLTITYKPAFQ